MDRVPLTWGSGSRLGLSPGPRTARAAAGRLRAFQDVGSYHRHDFHPGDSDTTELVETCREQLFGEQGILNDQLIGAAA